MKHLEDTSTIEWEPRSFTSVDGTAKTYGKKIEVAPPRRGEVDIAVFKSDTGHFRVETGVPVAETFIVYSGRLTIKIDGGEYELGPGSIFRLPADTPFETIVYEEFQKFAVKINP